MWGTREGLAPVGHDRICLAQFARAAQDLLACGLELCGDRV